MTKRHIVIATRESPLALYQAESVKAWLTAAHPSLSVELLGITTEADRCLDITLNAIGGKGLFVKELEEALYDGRADIAVHSMKDVPMTLPAGLCLPVIGEREDPRDAFVSNRYESIGHLPMGASIGTSSLRRQTQLKSERPDIAYQPMRGNIHTRLGRLDQGEVDALILAGAGLKRMKLTSRIRSYLSIETSLPAAGQGALGIECRENDHATLAMIAPLNELKTQLCVLAERAVCRQLGGNCQVPVAAYAEIHHGILSLRALVASFDGKRILRARLSGAPEKAEQMGIYVADHLLEQGAMKILKEFL